MCFLLVWRLQFFFSYTVTEEGEVTNYVGQHAIQMLWRTRVEPGKPIASLADVSELKQYSYLLNERQCEKMDELVKAFLSSGSGGVPSSSSGAASSSTIPSDVMPAETKDKKTKKNKDKIKPISFFD